MKLNKQNVTLRLHPFRVLEIKKLSQKIKLSQVELIELLVSEAVKLHGCEITDAEMLEFLKK